MTCGQDGQAALGRCVHRAPDLAQAEPVGLCINDRMILIVSRRVTGRESDLEFLFLPSPPAGVREPKCYRSSGRRHDGRRGWRPSAIPDAFVPPSHEPVVAGRARLVADRQVAPWCSRSQCPENSVQHAAIIDVRHASRVVGYRGSITRHSKSVRLHRLMLSLTQNSARCRSRQAATYLSCERQILSAPPRCQPAANGSTVPMPIMALWESAPLGCPQQ